MAKVRFLMNEGDGDYCAVYVDNRLLLDSWSGGMQVEDLLPKLVGLTIESVTIENTNLPFYDEQDEGMVEQRWPATIEDLEDEDV